MKFHLHVLIFLFSFVSCQKPEPELFSQLELQPLVELNSHTFHGYHDSVSPDIYYSTFFCNGEGNSIILLEQRELQGLYEKCSSRKSYSNYLYDLLNLRTSIDTIGKCWFIPDHSVKEEYSSNGVSYLLDKYCKLSSVDSTTFILKKNYHYKKYSIIYYLYRCGYRIIFDEYSNTYLIKTKNCYLFSRFY